MFVKSELASRLWIRGMFFKNSVLTVNYVEILCAGIFHHFLYKMIKISIPKSSMKATNLPTDYTLSAPYHESKAKNIVNKNKCSSLTDIYTHLKPLY